MCVLFGFVFCAFCGCCDSSAPNEDIVGFRCGSGSINPFVCIFVKTFQFFSFYMVFLLAFGRLLCLWDRFLIFDSLVASLYIGRIWMMEHLFTL